MVVSIIDNLTPLQARGLLRELRDTIKAGLNAGNGDGEWEALVNAGDLLGLEYDEEEDKYA
jgi:hypothetical protein